VRDFAAPRAYNIALIGFLVASLAVYFLLCHLSPDVLTGLARLLGVTGAQDLIKGVPYPLYIAALFMGLTQPIVPGLSQLELAQRNFFHDRIEVPGRIVDVAERLTTAIDARAGADKRKLAAMVRRLAGDAFLAGLQPHADIAFYRLQLDQLELGGGAPDRSLDDSSAKELRANIQRLVLSALVSVMRKSGPGALGKVAEQLGIRDPAGTRANVPAMAASLISSGLLFGAWLLIVSVVLHALGTPVEYLLGKSADSALWPSHLDDVGDELWSILLPIIACVALTLCMVLQRGRDAGADLPADTSLGQDFVEFVRSSASVLVTCVAVVMAIKSGQLLFEYGSTSELPAEARSLSRLVLPAIQSLIAIAVALFTSWYVVSVRRGPGHGLSFAQTALVIAGATGTVALVYDLVFMEQYLPTHPTLQPGTDHVLFAVIANILVAVGAFGSVAVFFRNARATKRTMGEAMPIPA
jgi:hypothetical protein